MAVPVCRSNVLVILLCLLPFFNRTCAQFEWNSISQNWLNHGGDLYNRRYAEKESRISPETVSRLRLKWEFYAGKDITATPAIFNGILYFPSWNGNIYAVKASDGSLIWQKNLHDLTGLNGTGFLFNVNWTVARATPTIADDLLIIGISGPAIVIAVERLTGELVWSTQLDNHAAAVITMSGTYYKGYFYVGTSSQEESLSIEECCTFRGSFSKLDAKSGRVLWQTYTLPDNFGEKGEYAGGGIWGSSPSIDITRNLVYIGTGNLYSAPLRIRECQEAENNQTVPNSPDKCIEPENHSNSILALDLDSGEIKWYHQLGGYDVWFFACNNLSTPNCPPGPNPDADFAEAPMMLSIIDVNGMKQDIVVAVQKSGFAWALNRDNGSLIWSTEAGPGGPAGGGTWGAATDKKRIYTNIANSLFQNFTLRPSTRNTTAGGWVAMDADSGEILWSTADPSNATATGPVTIANGVLFAGSTNNQGPIYGIDAKSGKILWSYNTGATVYGGMSVSNGCIYVGNGYKGNYINELLLLPLSLETLVTFFNLTAAINATHRESHRGGSTVPERVLTVNRSRKLQINSSPPQPPETPNPRTQKFRIPAALPPGGLDLDLKWIPQSTWDVQDWLSHGGNLLNRRFADKETKISPETVSRLRLKWKFDAGGYISATPAIYNGNLYFPSWNGYLHAVKASDGSLIWKKNLQQLTGLNSTGAVPGVNVTASRTTPAIADDLLIFGLSGPAYVGAVKRSNGQLVWLTQLDKHPRAVITMSGTYYKGHFYIGTSSLEEITSIDECCIFRGSFLKLNARTGKIMWQTYTLPDNFGNRGEYAGAAIWGSSPSIDIRRNHVYVATGNLYSAPKNVTDCQERQNNQTTGIPSHPDECVEPENLSDSIVAFDLDTGKIKWYRQLGGYDVWFLACNNLSTPNCPPGPNPDADFGEAPMMLSTYVNGTRHDLVVAVQKSGFAWALNRDNGNITWSTEAGPGGLGGGGIWGAAADEKRVYTNIANSDRNNFTLKPSVKNTTSGGWVGMDAKNGQILWSTADPSNGTVSGPVSVANGVLFGGSTSGQGPIYAINANNGKILWSFNTGATIYGGSSISNGCIYVGHGYFGPPFTPGSSLFAFCVS
ncbi:Quinonprotein alcohol dehydrogenase-like-superfamily [Corchorus olitorius]|uniref:Quinonprotein alcohol dehydrogenase-like-superfamily n=1 Tax=Corchorus olitorius TaxID=93759 RepID=A0A1R3GAW4_9ROSI|nr:Quinonprotein alcohol dehydrogenase-like-superfamily [Corchorus olitorius]